MVNASKALFISVAVLIGIHSLGAAQAPGGWIFDSTKDEMTDELRFYVSSDSRPTSTSDDDEVTGTIAWRCSATEGRELFLLLDKYFGGNSDDEVFVETRFDSEPPDSAWWNLSRNKRGAFMPTEGISRFTNRVERGRRLLIRVTDPLDGETVTYSFALTGFSTAYRRFQSKCPSGTKNAPKRSDSPTRIDSVVLNEPDESQVFMGSVVEERPEILTRPQLQYPDLLRQAGVQGRVLVQAIIDTAGRVEPLSVKVIQSPNPGFDQAAKSMVMQTLFRPGRVHGRPVRVLLNLPIDFTIKR